MSAFDINFQANTTGDHFVGYRTYNDPVNTYTVITVNVITPGLQSVTIDVPGNLYCATSDIEYTGYVIAECQDQTDGNADGIPDLALTWTVTLLEQADPCIKTDILCESVAIASIDISNNGTGSCSPDGVYPVTITETTAGDEIIAADIDVTVTGGIAVSTTINNPGQYKQAPILTHSVLNCESTIILFAVMATECPALTLKDYDCAGANDLTDTSIHTIAHTTTATICADVSTLGGLPSNFVATQNGNCHCEECQNVTVDVPGGTVGSGKITYQTCWDASNVLGSITTVSQTIAFGETIDLGCIIEGTLVLEQGTLDQPINSVAIACS